MRKAISTYVFIDSRLHSGMLDKLTHAGAEAIEIFAARNHFDYTDRQQMRELANWFKHNGVPLNSVHAPMFSDVDWGRSGVPPVNLVDRDKSRRIASADEIKRTLEFAETTPFNFLIQHLGTPGEEFDERKFEWALTSIEHLHAFAKPLGVKVLLENIPNDIATPENIVRIIDALHLDDLGACFDIGHAHIMSGVRASFEVMRPHVRSTHLHDNNGKDEHLFPGEGAIDWTEAVTLLRDAPHVPPFLMEIRGEDRKDVLEKFQSSFHMLEQKAQQK